MDNKNIDRFPFFAETFLTDSLGRVRPTTILNSMQSAGNRHAETRGFGATGSLGWVIARMALHIERTPMQRERLNIETWIRNLYHGFTDRCMRMIDEEGNEVSILEFMEDESPSSQEQYEEEKRLEELREKINKALAILTEKQRRRVLMRYVDEMTLQEIADIEGCDISTINESIEGAIKKIRKNF